MSLVPSFVDLLQPLSCVMTTPSFNSFQTVLLGWVFAPRRTVAGMILAADASGEKHHSAYHRLFASARWSLDELGLAVFGLILPLLGGVIRLVVDDTLARKRGLKVFGVGMHHDPILSSRKTAIVNWAHCWVILGVLVKFPFAGRCFCLPVLFRLYVSKQTIAKKGGVYRTKPELAVQLLHLLCTRYPHRHFHLLADSAYGGKSVLCRLPDHCDLTSRLKLDARLYEAATQATNPKGGRPRKRGMRLPTPQQMLEGRCRHLHLDIYGRHDKSRIAEGVARVHAAPDRPLKIVAVQPLSGGREVQAFYSTTHADSAEAVLTEYSSRYAIEDMFHEAKGQLGFEEPQGWSRQAVQRTAPVAMLLYSLVLLWFHAEGHRHDEAPNRPWYPKKPHASLADMLATLRCCSVREEVLSLPPHDRPSENLLQTLIRVVKHAA
jgi:hypothetical protein